MSGLKVELWKPLSPEKPWRIFLAALQSIPHELYEAARINDATGWQIVRHIKILMVRFASLLAVLLSIIETMQLFNSMKRDEETDKVHIRATIMVERSSCRRAIFSSRCLGST